LRYLRRLNLFISLLAESLSLSFDLLSSYFSELRQICEGIMLLEEASPRVQAKVMAMGELMLTKLGSAFLKKEIDIAWQDARDLLKSIDTQTPESVQYLTAICEAKFDQKVSDKIHSLKQSVVITQGFIASNKNNETVLLGRGGSDTSAAYLASKIGSKACEIWTDVPGIYTANPHLIPEARLLKQLNYAEAQEIASLGAKVLHPLCIPPLRKNQIPLLIKQTTKPEHPGTLVHLREETQTLPIKAIINKSHVFLVSIESSSMWTQSGFLADVFTLFKEAHLSINLVSTSETNVTLSLDPNPYLMDKIEKVLERLNQFTKAKLIGPCAAISLVGTQIRSILPQISHLFEAFTAQNIYLLSQAANDLNLTFVVDEAPVEKLVKKLHQLLIEQHPHSLHIGKSWQEEHGLLPKGESPWWENKQNALLSLAQKQSPLYVYDQITLEESADALLACDQITQIFYAMKANSNPEILKCFYEKGLNFECVSIEEVHLILKLFPDIKRDRILFTPNFAPKVEYQVAIEMGVLLTIDSLFPLQKWPELFKGQTLLIRVDPGEGMGHHKHVKTGGNESKFGIPQNELEEVAQIAQNHKINVIGLHSHSGSGILSTELWQNTAKLLTQYLNLFPHVKYINLGGGLGVVEKPGQKALAIQAFNDSLKPIKKAYPHIDLWIEPGRYLVAKAGVLIAKVTQVKQKGEMTFVGIETGMNSLIRPALYGAYHEIINLSRIEQAKTQLVNIVGPICESGDTLGYSRFLPETTEGDVMLIANAGAYGYCMSSYYNLRPPAQEHFLKRLLQTESR
jgi:bifunctional diaminopimelate decarboxylase / aspartate kinase